MNGTNLDPIQAGLGACYTTVCGFCDTTPYSSWNWLFCFYDLKLDKIFGTGV